MSEEPENDIGKNRREFIKKTGLVGGGVALGTPAIAERGSAVNVTPSGTDLHITKKQDSSSAQFPVTASSKARYVTTADLGDMWGHYYEFDTTFTSTDGYGNKTDMIGTHQFRWDASDARSPGNWAIDNQSRKVGCSPDPDSGASEPQEIFQDMIEATAGAASTTAGVAISANEIVQQIVNHITDFDDSDPDIKQWKWEYGNLNHQDVTNHQLNPEFRHYQGKTPTWKVQSVAEGYGIEYTFYGGDTPYVQGGETSVSSTSTVESTTDSNLKVVTTPGLKPHDFHELPSTTGMTKRERKKYGVREPTQAEKEMFGGEVVNIVERYPFAITAESIDRTTE